MCHVKTAGGNSSVCTVTVMGQVLSGLPSQCMRLKSWCEKYMLQHFYLK